MIILNETDNPIRVERWIINSNGIATLVSVVLNPQTDIHLEDSQVSLYDIEYRYIGCLYDKPKTYKRTYLYIDNHDYEIEHDAATGKFVIGMTI